RRTEGQEGTGHLVLGHDRGLDRLPPALRDHEERRIRRPQALHLLMPPGGGEAASGDASGLRLTMRGAGARCAVPGDAGEGWSVVELTFGRGRRALELRACAFMRGDGLERSRKRVRAV